MRVLHLKDCARPWARARYHGIGLVVSILAAAPAMSQDCAPDLTTGLESTGPEPEASVACPPDVPDFSFDVTAGKPAIAASGLADFKAPAADGTPLLPFTVKPSDGGLSARTSLGTLRDYNAKVTAKKYDEAVASRGNDMLLRPKPVPAPASPVDVWSSVEAQSAASPATSSSARAGAGIDYQVLESAKVGVTAEAGESSGAAAPSSRQDKLSAYATLKASPLVSIDTRTEWTSDVSRSAEGMKDTGKSALIVSPRLEKQYSTGGGETIKPFVSISREFDFSAPADAAAKGANSAGAGVTFARPGDYSLSLTTGLEGIGGKDPADVKSGIEFKMPIK